MRFFETFVDVISFVFSQLKALLLFFGQLIVYIFQKIFEKFREIDFPEKIIMLNTIAAAFAVVMPVARFELPRLGLEWYVNNPLAVYLIGIAFIMIFTVYVHFPFFHWVRIATNAYYLFWIVYIPLSEGLVKAQPHAICTGYYLNIIVPVVYLIAAIAHMAMYNRSFR